MKLRILIIVNPKAGKAKSTKYIKTIRQNLEKLNYNVEIKFTTKQNNGTSIIQEYKKDYNILIVSGGDGTLNEVITGLHQINKKAFIGYIPNGTTNDFGKSLKVSFNRMHLSENIKKYSDKAVDIGSLNGRPFIYSATFGIFTKTSYTATAKWKNRVGRLAYIALAIKEIFDYKVYKVKVQANDKEYEDEFIYGSISNSQYIGGFNIFKNQNVELDDGKFEVLLVKKPKSFIELLRLALKVLNGNLNDKNVYCFQTDDIHITSNENLDWAIDGECGEKGSKFDICNLNQYIHFILPQEQKI